MPGLVAAPRRAQLEHGVRSRPAGKRRQLVGADQKDRIVESECLERVDRARIGVERHLCLADRGERELGEPEPDRRVRLDLLVTWIGDDTDEQPIEAEALDRLFGERDVAVVRRVEGTAQDPDTTHCQITTSPPISTSEPDLTPASLSASSSSSPSGGVPTTRKPWPVRSTRYRRRSGGRGRYSRNAGSSSAGGSGAGASWGAEAEEQRFQLVDAGSRRARDAVHGHDPLVLHRERRRRGVQVGLVEDDELRPLSEAGAVALRARGRSPR